ncbi:DUF72 domain-containing protein [bacterium]|nr:DUF72 domain-containing protein [candidate division CSSED10-310 bacterium]
MEKRSWGGTDIPAVNVLIGMIGERDQSSKIRVGTSGYSYSDWKGVFYPEDLPRGDQLNFYGTQFDVLEINFTYYKMPSRKQIEGMIRRAGSPMEFTVKANREFTHGSATPRQFSAFMEALDPMIREDRLGCVLFQFPYGFKCSDAAWKHIEMLAGKLGSIRGAVEFRHDSWISDRTFRTLADLNLAFCCLDQPDLPGLPGIISAVTSKIAYIRFHGRNRDAWWRHEHAWQRYNYLYGEDELAVWVPVIRRMVQDTERIYVFFNNHYQGQAVTNARMLMAFLDG